MFKKTVLIFTLTVAACGVVHGEAPVLAMADVPESKIWRGYAPPWSLPSANIISPYDPVIRQAASAVGLDWRFVSAVACAESRFDRGAVSRAGAVGLMQIMPSVARSFKVPPGEMTDPLTNVTMGARHLDQISKTFRFPRTMSERDRLSIILAAYNCGPGRVLDARRLAVKYGENHNSWSVVAKYLTLMNDPAYYQDEVVRTGVFHDNAQTLGFVRK
ncbi:MAG: transglycosylase SLT domain-containing protein, partial [Alistipes sp.]|nr:transglycosylase SLT domain-containing protein [Alistipes sp.]